MKAIILDRDGIINKCMPAHEYITKPSEISYLHDNLDIFKKIKKDIPIFIVTNQQGVGKDLMSSKDLDSINNIILKYLKDYNISILKIFTCTHLERDKCNCRKPKPGMLFDLAKEFKVDLTESIFIGDSETDIICANSANCISLYYGSNKIETKPTYQATNSSELLKILKLNGLINN